MQIKKILNQNSKGITLVALVVTIIVLLILAGITIGALFGDNGIINKAQKAKDEQLRANEKERLDLIKMEVAAKNEGKVDIDDFIQDVIDKGITDKVEDKEDGSKEFETDTGFDVTVKPNPDNENDVIIIIGGGGGNGGGGDKTKAPTIKEIAVTSGVDNIKVDVKTENADDATYKYYYKTDEDEEYTLAHEGKEPSYTIKPLAQDTKYTIKVEVSTKGGTATDEVIARTGKIPSAVGAITFTNSTWSGGKQSVQVNKTTTDNYKIEYQIMDENGNVKIDYTEIASGERISNLSHGDIVIARLTDGQNKGNSATYNVRDNTLPTVTVTKGTVTSNSIQVNVNATDNESGMQASTNYKYYIKKSSITSYSTSSQTSNTFTGLDPNTSYDIKVEVADVAGNIGIGELINAKTDEIRPDPWTQNPDGTITNGLITAKLGDYVNYNNATSTATYTSTTAKSGASSDQIFKANEYTDGWRIMGVDSNKQLMLISASYVKMNRTNNEYVLSYKAGYENGVDELNKICKIYGNGEGAIDARCPVPLDIDKLTGFVRKNISGTYGAYGVEVTYTRNSGTISLVTPTGSKFTGEHKGFHYYDEKTKTWKTLASGQSMKAKSNNYSYSCAAKTGDGLGNQLRVPDNVYKLLFSSNNSLSQDNTKVSSFALAERYTKLSNNCITYGLLECFKGVLTPAKGLLISTGTTEPDRQLNYVVGVRPIVLLKSDVELKDTEQKRSNFSVFDLIVK